MEKKQMNRKFPFEKMESYGQPYKELGSAMFRVLSLYLEGREFDSGAGTGGGIATLQWNPNPSPRNCHFTGI